MSRTRTVRIRSTRVKKRRPAGSGEHRGIGRQQTKSLLEKDGRCEVWTRCSSEPEGAAKPRLVSEQQLGTDGRGYQSEATGGA